MGAEGKLVETVGPPLVLGPAPARNKVHRLRDFWAVPASGLCGKARWYQTMGSIVLRMALEGTPWHGTTEDEFQVHLCELGLRIKNKRRPDASEAFLKDSMNGDFPHEVLVGSSWWSLESGEDDAERPDATLVIHLVKARDGSWKQPFNEGRPADPVDLSSEWANLRPGQRAEGAEDVKTNVSPLDVFQELAVSQTEDLIMLRLFVNQSTFDEARQQVPMSRLWGLDLTETTVKVFLRSEASTPLLAGRLGGKIMPDQTDWSMTKVTRELAGSADGVGTRETRAALSVQLRKATDCREEWDEIIKLDTRSIAYCKAAIGKLDEDDDAAHMLRLQGEEAPDREGWGAADYAKELKAKGDECFKRQEWGPASEHYTHALHHTPDNEKILSNRSAAYVEVKRYQDALDDAMRVAEIAPEWPKSFFRQGIALRALKRYDMAISAFSEGKTREPNNPNWQREVDETEALKGARQAARARTGARR